MMHADLHIHSEYSNDGELKVNEIIEKCIDNNVTTLSITDHNSVKGNEQAVSLCMESGIHYIPGIEIDCNYRGVDLHLLAYHIDWKSKDFEDLENSIKGGIMESLPKMMAKLLEVGIEVNMEEVLDKSEGKVPVAELFAEVLLDNRANLSNPILKPYRKGGSRSDMPYINFYLDFFAQGKPGYVKLDHISFQEALELVRSHGGIPVVAHPGLNFAGKEEMVGELLDQGAAGLEVFNNYHDVAQVDYFASLAEERQMLMTCGSDFHGKNKPLIQIGKYASYEKYEAYLSNSVDLISHNNTEP